MTAITVDRLGAAAAATSPPPLLARAEAPRVEARVAAARARAARVDELRGRLDAVRTAARGLADLRLGEPAPSARSGDGARVGARADGRAARATHAVEVAELARAGVATQTSPLAAAPADDILHITAGGVVDVAIAAGDDLATIARRIGEAGAGVDARVLGGRLVLTGRATGTASEIAVASDGDLADRLAVGTTLAARDARFSIDGVERTSASNRVADALPGVELDLRGVTARPVEVDVDPRRVDGDLAASRMRGFVAALDGLVAAAESAIARRGLRVAGAETAETRADDAVIGLLDALRRTFPAPAEERRAGALDVPGLVPASDGSGRVELDGPALAAAVAADPGAVEEALGRTGTGEHASLLTRVDDLAQRFLATAGGPVVATATIDARDALAAADARLVDRAAALRREHAAMGRLLTGLGALGDALAPAASAA